MGNEVRGPPQAHLPQAHLPHSLVQFDTFASVDNDRTVSARVPPAASLAGSWGRLALACASRPTTFPGTKVMLGFWRQRAWIVPRGTPGFRMRGDAHSAH